MLFLVDCVLLVSWTFLLDINWSSKVYLSNYSDSVSSHHSPFLLLVYISFVYLCLVSKNPYLYCVFFFLLLHQFSVSFIYIWDSIKCILFSAYIDVWNVVSKCRHIRVNLKTKKFSAFLQLHFYNNDKLESCPALFMFTNEIYSVLYSLYDYQNNSEAFSSRYKLDATTIKSVKQVVRSSNNLAMRRDLLPEKYVSFDRIFSFRLSR